MYPYHNRIKQRINNGELISIEKTNLFVQLSVDS